MLGKGSNIFFYDFTITNNNSDNNQNDAGITSFMSNNHVQNVISYFKGSDTIGYFSNQGGRSISATRHIYGNDTKL